MSLPKEANVSYTIGEMSKKTGLSIHTLRYYEKEGIVPPPCRDDSGIRLYNNKDVEAVKFVRCLRAMGMSIADIKRLAQKSTSIKKRLEMLEQQKEKVKLQLAQLTEYQTMIDRKITIYNEML